MPLIRCVQGYHTFLFYKVLGGTVLVVYKNHHLMAVDNGNCSGFYITQFLQALFNRSFHIILHLFLFLMFSM